MQNQKQMSNAEQAGWTTRTPGKTCKEILNKIQDSPSDLGSPKDKVVGEAMADEEWDTELC
jgi:hypothetical protein